MKTIKAKQTIIGVYGQLGIDDTANVRDKIADQLAEKGLVEIIDESAGEDPTNADDNSSSVKINEKTKKEKVILGTEKEKKADAGPVKPETKAEPAKAAEKEKEKNQNAGLPETK